MTRSFLFVPIAALLAAGLVPGLVSVRPADAAPPKKPVPPKSKPNNGEATKGTVQMKGGDGIFGIIYTMVNGSGNNYNLQLIKARYTLEPHNDYNGTLALPDQKMFVLTFAVKNPNKDKDLDLGGVDITVVDENDNNYQTGSGTTRLTSSGDKSVYINLKPGQGLGQDPTVNELSTVFVIPGSAKIKKVIVNNRRASMPTEKVMRYTMAGSAGGSPQNVIAPLPKYAADPTDPSGGVALEIAQGVMGKYYPDGYFAARLNSVTFSTPETTLNGDKAPDGKQWAMANFTVKNIFSKAANTFEIAGDGITLKDADGEKYAAEGGRWKVSRDEALGSMDVEKKKNPPSAFCSSCPKT